MMAATLSLSKETERLSYDIFEKLKKIFQDICKKKESYVVYKCQEHEA